MALSGFATPEGTARYKARALSKGVAEGHFRQAPQGALQLTGMGMGSYLGASDAETDAQVSQAVKASLLSGAINVLDTAINYRFMRAERAIGAGLAELFAAGEIQRDEIFVASKIGYLTPNADVPMDFRSYFNARYLDTGLVQESDIVNGLHCMAPGYLRDQLDQSLKNLGLETLDLIYLHNAAESQLAEVGETEFMRRLRAAFEVFEEARTRGKIKAYGMATWDCFRVSQDDASNAHSWLSLEACEAVAREVGGDNHGFRFIQVPFNLAFNEAGSLANQPIKTHTLTTFEVALNLEMGVFTSVPLLQGQLLDQVGPIQFPGCETASQKCLQFVRSYPGVLAPLVGQKNPAHVSENIALASIPPLTVDELQQGFSQPA